MTSNAGLLNSPRSSIGELGAEDMAIASVPPGLSLREHLNTLRAAAQAKALEMTEEEKVHAAHMQNMNMSTGRETQSSQSVSVSGSQTQTGTLLTQPYQDTYYGGVPVGGSSGGMASRGGLRLHHSQSPSLQPQNAGMGIAQEAQHTHQEATVGIYTPHTVGNTPAGMANRQAGMGNRQADTQGAAQGVAGETGVGYDVYAGQLSKLLRLAEEVIRNS